MKYITLIILGIILVACNNTKKSGEENVGKVFNENPQKKAIEEDIHLEVYDFNGLEKLLNKKDGKIHVINFWATWCAPCVKELPHFEKAHDLYSNRNVEVILVSLDFPHAYDNKLKPFIIDNKLSSKVVALDDADMNTWIPKVDKSWSGSIPATVIYNDDKRMFFEKSFTYDELETEIKQFLK